MEATMTPELITALLLALPVLGLVWLVAWEIGKMAEAQKYLPPHPSTIEHIDLTALTQAAPLPQEQTIKETPAINRLHIPPPVFSGYSADHTGISLSGMGGGWAPAHKLVPKQYRRRMRSDWLFSGK
jgi:hypothetical protein